MADEAQPEGGVEGLIGRPLFEDDSGGQGIGPTLGSRAPDDSEAISEANRDEVWPSDEDENEPDLFPDAPRRRTYEHALGSEIARSGEDLSADVLRGAEPPSDDDAPRAGRIERASPGVAAPDLPAPPPGGWPPEGGFSRRTPDA